MSGAEQPGAGGHHGLPVGDGRVGQPAVLQRQPGPEQQRVGLRLPQHRPVGGPQGRGAVAQGLLELGLLKLVPGRGLVVFWPGLEQRVRGGQQHLLQVGGRQVGPHRGLHAGVHLHGARRAGRVDGDQPGLGQVVDGGARHVLVGPVRGARPAGDVAAGGRAGQHRARHPVVIEHRGQRQRRPGQPGRRQLVRALRGDGPGGQDRRRDTRHGGHVRDPLGQHRAVLPAALPAGAHHRGGLGQPEQQAVQVLAQVQRLDPLVGVLGEPGGDVVQGLAAVQPGHRDGPHVVTRERCVVKSGGRQPRGDHDPAGRAGRPQLLQVAQLGQVVEDQRPRPPGAGQPGHEAGRGGLRAFARLTGVDRVRRLGESGQDRFPAGGGHPDQDLHRPGVPHGMGELHRQLGLACAALGGRRQLGVLAVDQHHGLPGAQAAGQVRPGLLAQVIGIGERRHGPGQQHPGSRTRYGYRLLRDHDGQPLSPPRFPA